MDAFVNQFNNVSATKFNRTVKLDELDGHTHYPVKNMRIVKTKYGDHIVTTLLDLSNGGEIDVFLPQRYVKVIDPTSFDMAFANNLRLLRGDKVSSTYNIRLEIVENLEI